MKPLYTLIGLSLFMVLSLLSCQKDILTDPQNKISGPVLLTIATDSVTQSFTLKTASTPSITQTSTPSVNYLKTFTPNAGGNETFTIESNTSWNVTDYPNWMTVSPLSGTGSGNITVMVSANTGAQRSSAITITGTGVSNSLTVNALQLAATTTTSTLSANYLQTFSSNAGDQGYFILTSNTTWKIENYPGWVIVSPLSGTGNAHVMVTVMANTGAQRSGTITVSGSGVSQYVSINVLQVAGVASTSVTQANYYLAPSGNDNNPGTITEPFYSLSKLASVIQPGQVAYLRGGRYNYSSQSQLAIDGLSGSSGNLITIENYPGETPTICPGPNYPSGTYGIDWNSSSYIHFKGVEITGFVQSTSGGNIMGIWVYGNSNYNIFELINYHGNGFPFTLEPEFPGATSPGKTNPGVGTGNQIINCDFYRDYDPYTSDANAGGAYGNGYGLIVYTNSNTTTIVTGCRCWSNCGDGFDYYAYGPSGMIITTNCWSWYNGYKPDGTQARGGDGCQGFKIGGYNQGSDQSNILNRTYTNCFAGFNSGSGFESNGQQSLVNLYNNSTYRNASNGYDLYESNQPQNPLNWILENNLSYNDQNVPFGNIQSQPVIDNNNSWDHGFTISSSDFISLDTTGLSGPRQADGSLPNLNFLKLSSSSPLYTKGVDLGLGYGKIIGFTYQN